jgi:hypothetical protein
VIRPVFVSQIRSRTINIPNQQDRRLLATSSLLLSLFCCHLRLQETIKLFRDSINICVSIRSCAIDIHNQHSSKVSSLSLWSLVAVKVVVVLDVGM